MGDLVQTDNARNSCSLMHYRSVMNLNLLSKCLNYRVTLSLVVKYELEYMTEDKVGDKSNNSNAIFTKAHI